MCFERKYLNPNAFFMQQNMLTLRQRLIKVCYLLAPVFIYHYIICYNIKLQIVLCAFMYIRVYVCASISLDNIFHMTYLLCDKYAIFTSTISSQYNGSPLAKLDTANIVSDEQSGIIRISICIPDRMETREEKAYCGKRSYVTPRGRW